MFVSVTGGTSFWTSIGAQFLHESEIASDGVNVWT